MRNLGRSIGSEDQFPAATRAGGQGLAAVRLPRVAAWTPDLGLLRAVGATAGGLSGQLRTAYAGESNCLLETEGRGASNGALRELIPAQCPGCQWSETSESTGQRRE
jgi:hypothetical protein